MAKRHLLALRFGGGRDWRLGSGCRLHRSGLRVSVGAVGRVAVAVDVNLLSRRGRRARRLLAGQRVLDALEDCGRL